jgi:hypothetical protein
MASKFEFVTEENNSIIHYGSPKMLINIHMDSIVKYDGIVYESLEFVTGKIYAEWVCTKSERESSRKFTEQRQILKKAIDFYIESVFEKQLAIPESDQGTRTKLVKELMLNFTNKEKAQMFNLLKRITTDTSIPNLTYVLDRLSIYFNY